ncbi:molybdopterin-synthase adenylyltransferase MoeB [Candidatus Methylacidithermus pantelleriae]|uniref:Molybdopterin-synthase adenylyltransferase n=1 Tax=Candidatus Methylacidithermus pantelleriae TaxID=2744239 RepID=A0A8J2BMQ4_9BACT|nr:molybdopterin-synthase adenylyltransferase MoeB [Candidatus Methylacidithermus pantelleriae]CAF0693510.1 Sulfur carrier protein CysO adenylyltransferase / Sulfur carrier protein CysO sulfurtransferase [Candidatus Methylacidithermus pantelleriae]
MSYLSRIEKVYAGSPLSHDEIRRYGRHLIMPEVTASGQKKLKSARVLVVGAGGLGSPLLLYLAAAGVGTIGIVDFDVVEESNLHRQVLHKTSNVGKRKVESAKEAIAEVNPHVAVVTYDMALRSGNALELLRDYDVVVDGTDNFPTRYLVNDACALLGKPNVYGSIFRFEGQASVFWRGHGPCYRCLFPQPPEPGTVPSCAEGGVLGVLPGVIGVIQAIETVKLIVGIGEPLIGRLLVFDALRMRFAELRLRPDPKCPLCGEAPTLRELVDYEEFCGLRTSATGPSDGGEEMSVVELKEAMERGEDFLLIDVREPHEYELARIPGSQLIPLGELPARLHELDAAKLVVVHCKTGGRSARACRLLREAGFRRVKNLAGGIEAWSQTIDPSVPRY